MISGDLRSFLELCHTGSSTFDTWLADLSPAICAVAAPREGVMVSAGRAPHDIFVCPQWTRGRAEILLPMFPRLIEAIPDAVARACSPFGVTFVSRQFGRIKMTGTGNPIFDAVFDSLGFVDVLGIMAHDGPFCMWVTIPLTDRDERSVREPLLHCLRRHLQSGLLARRAVTCDDIMADPEGRIVHSGSEAPDASTRKLLKMAARAYDKERCGAAPDADAERVWHELWKGGWAVVEAVDTDGKRMLVLRRDPTNLRSRALNRRERHALELLARGASYKSIGFELGMSLSRASEVAAKALAKLGFRSRTDFVRHMGVRATPKK